MAYQEKEILPGDPETDPELYEVLYPSRLSESEEEKKKFEDLTGEVGVTHWPPQTKRSGGP